MEKRHRNFNAFKRWNYDFSKLLYKRSKLIDFLEHRQIINNMDYSAQGARQKKRNEYCVEWHCEWHNDKMRLYLLNQSIISIGSITDHAFNSIYASSHVFGRYRLFQKIQVIIIETYYGIQFGLRTEKKKSILNARCVCHFLEMYVSCEFTNEFTNTFFIREF